MRKMNFLMFTAVLAAAFVFTSCLKSDNSPSEYVSLVTVEHGMMGVMFIPDESPKQVLIPTNATSTFDAAKRALIYYTIPEGQDVKATQIKIALTANSGVLKMSEISNRKDTIADYTNAFSGFVNYKVGFFQFPAVNVVRDYYLNVGYGYTADKVGKVAMIPDRISNDTIYLDLLLKKEGTSRSSGPILNCYDLRSMATNGLLDLSQLQPSHDSICVTVSMKVSEYGDSNVKLQSKTAKFHSLFR